MFTHKAVLDPVIHWHHKNAFVCAKVIGGGNIFEIQEKKKKL